MKNDQAIQELVRQHYPDVQAIYRFGSCRDRVRADRQRPGHPLLPPDSARRAGTLALGDLHLALEAALSRDVDLINLRLAPAVLQAQIVVTGTRMFCTDALLADEFELLALALYQKLNQERAGIVAEGLRSGSFLAP
ncbi:MAG: nucleotidyltransferase domain-containing protein [Gammaproteobacteria bacterium]|nr:nucleotidyltransferase domain-containing protein [Gammaproteobacteria bacterium]